MSAPPLTQPSLAHVWRVTRRDGAVFGFTDHDAPLTFDGLACAPQTGLTLGLIERSVGLEPDTASIEGALTDAAIQEDDLAAGLWDLAQVEVFRVDWRATANRLRLFTGRLGEVRRGALGFLAEVRGLQAPLGAGVGRVFARACDADLGDARCGVALASPAFTGAGVIAARLDPAGLRVTGLDAFPPGWFARGTLTAAGVAPLEVLADDPAADGRLLTLAEAPPALAAGVAVTVSAGCDKRHATCIAKFANALNFRGFPHMPGIDAVIGAPSPDGRNDGGSRWTAG